MGRFVKNSFLYFITEIILKGSGFLLIPIFSKYLSPEEYGTIYLVQAMSAFLTVFFSFSSKSVIYRYYFDNSSFKQMKKLFSSVFIYVFINSSIILLLLVFFKSLISELMEIPFFPYLFIGIAFAYLNAFYFFLLSFLYAKEESKIITILNITLGVTGLLLTVLFVLFFEDKVFGYLISLLCISIAQTFVFIFYLSKYFTFKIDLKTIYSKYLKYAISHFPSNLSSWIITFSDRLMINKYINVASTGIYSIGYQIGSALLLVTGSVDKAYSPFVFSKYANLNSQNKVNLSKIALYLFSFFTFISLFICIFSKEIIYLIDNRYHNSVYIMIIIMLTYMIDGYRIIIHNPITYNEKFVKYKSLILVTSSILNVILNIILIPQFSIYGAAIASLLTFVIRFIPIYILSQKAIKINYPLKKIILIVFASGCIFPLTFVNITVVLLLLKIFFIIVYLVILLSICNINSKMVKSFLKNPISHLKEM